MGIYDNLEQLKEEVNGWKHSLVIRKATKEALKIGLIQRTKELKEYKSKTNKEIKRMYLEITSYKRNINREIVKIAEAKRGIKTNEIKIKKLPSIVRQHNKKYMGKTLVKILNLGEEVNQR